MIETASTTTPPPGKKCEDCGCCLATVKAGDNWICWDCDEGKTCRGKRAVLSPRPAPIALPAVTAPEPPAAQALWATAPQSRAGTRKGIAKLPGEKPRGSFKPSTPRNGHAFRLSAEARIAIGRADASLSDGDLAAMHGTSRQIVHDIRRKVAAQRAEAAQIFAGAIEAVPDPEPTQQPPISTAHQEEKPMPSKLSTPQHIKDAIIAAGFAVSARELAVQHGVSDSTVFAIRKAAGVKRTPKQDQPRTATHAKKAAKKQRAKAAPQTALAVAGPTFVSFIGQLEGAIDEARIDRIYGRLSAEQRAIAVEAAIRAPLA
jgi:hypothetical protein